MLNTEISTVRELVSVAFTDWLEDEPFRLSASVAYFAIFSIAPVLIIVVAIINAIYSGNSQQQIETYIGQYVGPDASHIIAVAVQEMGKRSGSGVVPTILGITGIVLGASGVFTELQSAMNRIWEIEVRSGGFRYAIRNRLTGFLLVVFIATLLLISMLITTALSLYGGYFERIIPATRYIWPHVNSWISFAVLMVLFGILFRFLPDAVLHWRDVWVGAAVTAALFSLGRYGIAFYLLHSGVQSAYGAAGTILVVLLWIYYSTLIFFLGAEFTQVYADFKGRRVKPRRYSRHCPRRESHHAPTSPPAEFAA